MSEILSIESIQRAARAAAASGARVANPYPELHPAHDLWAATYAASMRSAFSLARPRSAEGPSAGIARPALSPRRPPYEIEPRGSALRRQAMSKARI